MTKEDAQIALDNLNSIIKKTSLEISQAGFHVDMEIGATQDGLMTFRLVANE